MAARDKVRLPDVADVDESPDSETEAEACAAAKMHGGPVQMWLIDTGCGHDLVARKELKALKRLIRQANIPLNFSTANGEVPANECADLFVKELNEAIEPYVLEDTPAVLSVGMRCMKLGYTFIWPKYENPYFITPSGMIVQLEVKDDIPYIVPGSETCKAKQASKRRKFACPSRVAAPAEGDDKDGPEQSGAADSEPEVGGGAAAAGGEGAGGPSNRAAESGSAGGSGALEADLAADVGDLVMESAEVVLPPEPFQPDPEQMDREEAEANLHETIKSRLRREAQSLKHKLTHKPKNPFCDACNRAKMRRGKRFTGSYNRKPEAWGWCITCDHIVSKEDNMLGIRGERDCLTIKDLWSGLKHCYPTQDKTAAETIRCLKLFIGDRPVPRVYSDNSGEIGSALKKLNLMPENSQPGRHETNAIIERENQDMQGGIKTLLEEAGLPLEFWSFAAEHYTFLHNVHRRRITVQPYPR